MKLSQTVPHGMFIDTRWVVTRFEMRSYFWSKFKMVDFHNAKYTQNVNTVNTVLLFINRKEIESRFLIHLLKKYLMCYNPVKYRSFFDSS